VIRRLLRAVVSVVRHFRAGLRRRRRERHAVAMLVAEVRAQPSCLICGAPAIIGYADPWAPRGVLLLCAKDDVKLKCAAPFAWWQWQSKPPGEWQ
jgi:hypothetical protein